jgi:hypothetical protein
MVGLRSLNEDLSLPTPAHEKESEEKKYAITARNTRASQRHADEEHDDNDNEEAFNDEFLVRARKDGVMLLPSYLELSKATADSLKKEGEMYDCEVRASRIDGAGKGYVWWLYANPVFHNNLCTAHPFSTDCSLRLT